MSCELCDISHGEGNAIVLYRDNDVIVALRDAVVVPGQITVFPLQHYTIFEQVPDTILEKCAVAANKVSVAVFEQLGAQGTNILVQNGLGAGQKIPHVALEIIPRQEKDNVPLQWEPKQIMEDEMEMVFHTLKEGMEQKDVPAQQEQEKERTSVESHSEGKEEKKKHEDKGENYLLKQIRRLP